MWTFGRKIAAGFTLAFVLLVAVGAVAYRSIAALTQTSYMVAHAHVVLEHLTTAQSLLKDAETGARGFLLTGDEVFLEPYLMARPRILAELSALDRLGDTDPEQRAAAAWDGRP